MTVNNSIKRLNTTPLERAYTAAHIDNPSVGSVRKAFARLWLWISGSWKNPESASLKKYQTALHQLATHAEKTKILDTELAGFHGIVVTQSATSTDDPNNLEERRYAELGPKIQAFYQALKGRVQVIEPNRAKHAALYEAGLRELTKKISDSDMQIYLRGKFRQHYAFVDLENNATPQLVAEHGLKPLAEAIDYYISTFISPDLDKYRKMYCDRVRKHIRTVHAYKFYDHMKVLREASEKHIQKKEGRLCQSIEHTKNRIHTLDQSIEHTVNTISALKEEIQKFQAKHRIVVRSELDESSLAQCNIILQKKLFKAVVMETEWNEMQIARPLSLDEWNNLDPENKLKIIVNLRTIIPRYDNRANHESLRNLEMILINCEIACREEMLPDLEESRGEENQQLNNLEIEHEQIRTKKEQIVQVQIQNLALFTTKLSATSKEFHKLAYPG